MEPRGNRLLRRVGLQARQGRGYLVGAAADGEVFDQRGRNSEEYFVIEKNAVEIKEKNAYLCGLNLN